MGKHEVIEPSGTWVKREVIKPSDAGSSSTERVRKHREAMRAKGFRLKQVWVPDYSTPAMRAEIAHANRVINEFERNNPEEAGWMDEFVARAWNDLPD